MDIEPLKNAFWAIVVDCLVQFHGMPRGEATSAADALRARVGVPLPVAGPAAPWESDLFYHNEPLYVADDIAGRDADATAIEAEYEAIQDRHYGPAEQIAFGPGFRASSSLGASG
ncbi:hypothetical protein [Longimicrobium terrae]|uniref:Uncharacterized protein n=1 Tax=Longimicrobium terrae TaxID=1639882 RepID=A0A841GM39_9BACT|nr:hypothetical protein [Longimicrobium terrae]MBB4635457.1 hypothetical protein [Longimicrobium terrae]MBB6069851.1 hypothetical protein [Longimicrobium terrae]NNC30945.1 hypothetical protein [Longimicrobium terrae]NNC32769.1 hypothetical protein [Longimicrobium terrae]